RRETWKAAALFCCQSCETCINTQRGRYPLGISASLYSPQAAYLGTSVVPGQNLLIGTARLGHGVGPILAHPHPMAVSRNREGKIAPVPCHRKTGGAQVKQGAHLPSREGDA